MSDDSEELTIADDKVDDLLRDDDDLSPTRKANDTSLDEDEVANAGGGEPTKDGGEDLAYDAISAIGSYRLAKLDLPPPPSKLSALASGRLGRDASVSSPVAGSSGARALGQGAKAPCTISSSTDTADDNDDAKKHQSGQALLSNVVVNNISYVGNRGYRPKDYAAVRTGETEKKIRHSITDDDRATSTCTAGNCKVGYEMNECLRDLIHVGHTMSALPGPDFFQCLCQPDREHKIQLDKPILVILGDQFVPPMVGGNGRCAVVIRGENATPTTIMTAAKNFFDAKNGANLPANSIILISLTHFCMEVKAPAFLTGVDWLKRSLARLFYTRNPANVDYPAKVELEHTINTMGYTFIECMSVHGNVSRHAASALATAAYTATTVAGVNRKQGAGKVAATYLDEMAEDSKVIRHDTEVPPFYIPNNMTGAINQASVLTAATTITAYRGLSQGLNTEALMYYWARVIDRVYDYVSCCRLDSSYLPTKHRYFEFATSSVMTNLRFYKEIPNIKKKYAEKKALLAKRRLAAASSAAAENARKANFPAYFKQQQIILISSSNMRRLADQFKIRLPHIAVSVIKATFSSGSIAPRLNAHSKRSIISALEKLKLKKEDVVVVDGFCNALLTSEEVDPITSMKALKPVVREERRLGPSHHLVLENGELLHLVKDKTVSAQCRLITTVAEAAGRSGAKVLVMGPLPSFPMYCCPLPTHAKFAYEFDMAYLQRDINVYLTAANSLNTHRKGGNIIAVPFDVIVRGKIEYAWDGAYTVKYDNVHVHEWVLDEMIKSIISIAAHDNMKDLGLPEQHPYCYNRSFENWRDERWEELSAANRLPTVRLSFPVGEAKELATKNPKLPGEEEMMDVDPSDQ